MSSLALKILACVAMLVDHMAFLKTFAPYEDYMRLFGRIAFPIFCYLIAFGYSKTRNKYIYLLRLLIAGFISEKPFNYFVYGRASLLSFHNVFYTLALGLAAIIAYDIVLKASRRLWPAALFFPVFAAYAAHMLDTDYGYAGVLLIFLFHLSLESRVFTALSCVVFTARFFIVGIVNGIIEVFTLSYSFSWPHLSSWQTVQLFAAAAALPILLSNGERGFIPKTKAGKFAVKYGFYIFYPLHILLIGIAAHNFHL